MKKTILTLLLAITLLAPGLALAGGSANAVDIFPVCDKGNTSGTDASGTDVCSDVNTQKASKDNLVIHIIKIVINVLAFVIGIAAIIVIIICGIQMMINGDNPQEVAKARQGIIYALVGIIVALFAEAIVLFVLNKL